MTERVSCMGYLKLDYLPYEEREPNTQYRDVLAAIMDRGQWSEVTRQGERAKTLLGVQMRFDILRDGFPLITERKIAFWRKAINELGAMINGVHTIEDFERWGVTWWGDWGTEAKCSKRGLPTGDIGPASYGPMFHDWPDFDGTPYNQFAHLVQQISEFPNDRTHVVSPWHSAGLARDSGRVNKATIAPCHGWVQVRILNGKLNLHMKQRSGDVPIGVPSNLVQYAALMLLLCDITGFEPGEYIHYIVDAHIYEGQMKYVEQMLEREPRRLPTIHFGPDVFEWSPPVPHDSDAIHKLHGELFVLSDYDPHEPISEIPVLP